MNDRNAFLQGQGSPIKDDAAPPEQGWRGERSANEVAGAQSQRRHIPGVGPEVEEISGTAFAEAQGLDPHPQDEDGYERRTLPESGSRGEQGGDGVSDLSMAGSSPGGESAGAPYPHGRRKTGNDPGSIMGHGGQSEIDYHGPGHLGSTNTGDDDNRNGVAEKDD